MPFKPSPGIVRCNPCLAPDFACCSHGEDGRRKRVRRHLALAPLAACLFICATTAVGAKPSHYYSRAEVDSLIDQLRSELLSKIPPKPEPSAAPPAPPQGYSKAEVDDLLSKLRSDIERNAVTKQDIARATEPFVTSKQLDKAIDEATKTARLREKAIDNKIPTFPAWISPLLSLAALICAIVIPLWNRRNSVRDTADTRAHTVTDAAGGAGKGAFR